MKVLAPAIKVATGLPRGPFPFPLPLPPLPVELLRELVDYTKERERQETAREEVELELEKVKALKKKLKYDYRLKKEALDGLLKKLETAEGEELAKLVDAIVALAGA